MTDTESKEVELKPCPFCKVIPKRTICFGEQCIEHPPCLPRGFQCPLRKMVIGIDVWNKRPQDGKDNNGMEVCDTTATKRLAKACCKNCNTYPDNLGPCETFCQGGNERCVYCDHELKCHPIAWHLIENSQQPPKER